MNDAYDVYGYKIPLGKYLPIVEVDEELTPGQPTEAGKPEYAVAF